MKVLIHSNAPWAATGYGQQTGIAAPALRTLGHDVAISAFYGLQGAKMEWDGFPVYPSGVDIWGNDVVTAHALDWFDGDLNAGIILTLQDVWTLAAPSFRHFLVAAWTPVDHDPLLPSQVAFFAKHQAIPIAMSRFGETKLREAGLDPLYVPHSVDPRIRFIPDAREALGWQDDWFIVGMVAANKGWTPPRKSFPQVFDAFARFSTKHPEARLYLHTEQYGVNQGVNLVTMAAAYGIDQSKLLWCDQYQYRIGVPADALAYLYSAMDVLANPSYGEGFGVPIIEAQACGTPVIVSDFSAMPELVGWGWKLKGPLWWNPRFGSFQMYVPPQEIYAAMQEAYAHRKGRRKTVGQSVKAVEHAALYAADRVTETYWRPVMADLASRLPGEAKPANLAMLGVEPQEPNILDSSA